MQFAKDRFDVVGWERVAFLAEDFKWTDPVTSTITERLEDEAGVEVTGVRRIAEGTEDFTPIYDELEENEVDGAFTALAHIGTRGLVQWATQQRPFGFGGIHVPTQLPSYFRATEGAATSTFSQTTATPTSEVTAETVPYANAYQEAYDSLPVYTGYPAYDAVYILKEAIESAGAVGDALVSALEDSPTPGPAARWRSSAPTVGSPTTSATGRSTPRGRTSSGRPTRRATAASASSGPTTSRRPSTSRRPGCSERWPLPSNSPPASCCWGRSTR